MVDGSMHEWFSLSYASYLVVPRRVIQEMPDEWQQRLVDLLDEMHDTFDITDLPDYTVQARKGNRFIKDKYRHYRRPEFDLNVR